MSVNSYFDKIVVINLDRRIDRMRKMSEQLKSLGIEYERFNAYDAAALNISPILATKMSHLKVIENNIGKQILILEDDALFCENFNEKFERAIKELPENTDILYLGAYLVECQDYNQYWLKNIYSTGLQAYSIHPDKMQLILDRLKDYDSHIDIGISQLGLNAYVTIDNIVTQFPSYSDIRLRDVDDFNKPIKVRRRK